MVIRTDEKRDRQRNRHDENGKSRAKADVQGQRLARQLELGVVAQGQFGDGEGRCPSKMTESAAGGQARL